MTGNTNFSNKKSNEYEKQILELRKKIKIFNQRQEDEQMKRSSAKIFSFNDIISFNEQNYRMTPAPQRINIQHIKKKSVDLFLNQKQEKE